MVIEQVSTVIDQDGIQGTFNTREFEDQNQTHVWVTFPNNQPISIPKSVLAAHENGTYFIPISTANLKEQAQVIVIPIVREELQVSKETTETGKVRITKTVNEEQVTINESVLSERVKVDHVPVNRYVESPTEVRYEDGRMIIPIYEEVLVVEKRLMLREEIHVTRIEEKKPVSQDVTLRRENIKVERTDSTP